MGDRGEKQPVKINISNIRGIDIAAISLYKTPLYDKSIDTG